MKEKMMNIFKNDSSVFWSATIVALMAVVKAFADLFGIVLAPDFIDKLMGFLMAIIALLVVAGVLTKKDTEEEE